MENPDNQTIEELVYDDNSFICAENDIKNKKINTENFKNLEKESIKNIFSLNINDKIILNKNYLENYKKIIKTTNEKKNIDIDNDNENKIEIDDIKNKNTQKENPLLNEEDKEKIKNEGYNKIQHKLNIKEKIKNMMEYKKINKYSLPIYLTEDINNIYDINKPFGNIEIKICNKYEKKDEYFLSNRINLTFNN